MKYSDEFIESQVIRGVLNIQTLFLVFFACCLLINESNFCVELKLLKKNIKSRLRMFVGMIDQKKELRV